jgi:hypothetical protein
MSYESERPRKSSSSKTIWIILGIVGGLFLLVCGGCVIAGFLIWGKIGGPVKAQLAAQEFVQELGSMGPEAAYKRTSKGFQSRQSPAQFRAFVDRNPGLKSAQMPTFQVDPNTMSDTSSKFHATIPTASGTIFGTIKMVKEGDEWKVDEFTIP